MLQRPLACQNPMANMMNRTCMFWTSMFYSRKVRELVGGEWSHHSYNYDSTKNLDLFLTLGFFFVGNFGGIIFKINFFSHILPPTPPPGSLVDTPVAPVAPYTSILPQSLPPPVAPRKRPRWRAILGSFVEFTYDISLGDLVGGVFLLDLRNLFGQKRCS